MNESETAMSENFESFQVFCSWIDGDKERVNFCEKDFDSLWNNKEEKLKVYDFPELPESFIQAYKTSTISIESLKQEEKPLDFEKKLDEKEMVDDSPLFFRFPSEIRPRPYQKEAIKKFIDTGFQCLFAMATGTGKTLTSLFAADELCCHKTVDSILIVVPLKDLVDQWENDVEAKYRAIHGPNSARAYPVGGLTVSREAAHYFPIILGINRAVNWAAGRPDVDKRRITYSGASQGGGFGLYLAALNKNITRAYIGVPALADVMGCKADGRQSGWPRILEFETQKDPVRLAKIEKNAPYLDGAYFAERITIPVRLSVGYADESCAPHAVLAAYNAIPSKDKKLYHGIGGVHSSPNAPMAVVNRWLAYEE